VDSLDKHMQNKKELIRLRRFMPAARTTRARSAQFRLRRELPCMIFRTGSSNLMRKKLNWCSEFFFHKNRP
jgi:hypothetical protein